MTMFYHPASKQMFLDHSAIRAAGLAPILPDILDAGSLAFLGVVQLAPATVPAETGKVAEPGEPAEIDGVWTQTWQLVDAPVEPLPDSVPMLNLKVTLGADGKLSLAETIIGQMPGEDGAMARAYWTNAQNAWHDNYLVAQLWPQLYETEAAFHDAWRRASTANP